MVQANKVVMTVTIATKKRKILISLIKTMTAKTARIRPGNKTVMGLSRKKVVTQVTKMLTTKIVQKKPMMIKQSKSRKPSKQLIKAKTLTRKSPTPTAVRECPRPNRQKP